MKLLYLLLGIFIPIECIGQNFQFCERNKYRDLYVADTKAIENSEQRWNKKRISRYSYTIIKGGVFSSREYRVSINFNRCIAKIKNDKEKWIITDCKGLTINELYVSMLNELSVGKSQFTVAYNKHYKFVERFSFYPIDDCIEDQGWHFTIKKFRAVRE